VGELAAGGLGVLMISSELEELVEGSSRVVVMRDGERVGELRGEDISQDNIIRAMAEGMTGEATAASTATTHATDTRPHAATPPTGEPPAEGAQ
jgi:ribose transport system ATP-binding protein